MSKQVSDAPSLQIKMHALNFHVFGGPQSKSYKEARNISVFWVELN